MPTRAPETSAGISTAATPNRTVMNTPTINGRASPTSPLAVSMASFIHENVHPQITVTTSSAINAFFDEWFATVDSLDAHEIHNFHPNANNLVMMKARILCLTFPPFVYASQS